MNDQSAQTARSIAVRANGPLRLFIAGRQPWTAALNRANP